MKIVILFLKATLRERTFDPPCGISNNKTLHREGEMPLHIVTGPNSNVQHKKNTNFPIFEVLTIMHNRQGKKPTIVPITVSTTEIHPLSLLSSYNHM